MYETSAIAVGPVKRKLFLVSGSKIKLFDFKDVREWSYKVITKNNVYRGAGLLGQLDNLVSSDMIVEGAGLFIKVRDVDNPGWHVWFRRLNKGEFKISLANE